MNHFFVVTVELMEKFLICGDCMTPIGFPHVITCSGNNSSTNELSFTWKKNKFDDKFITYGMQFCFNELLIPSNRKDIFALINRTCEKQQNKFGKIEKFSFPPASKSWPLRWIRNGGDKSRVNKFRSNSQHFQHQQQVTARSNNKFTYPVHIAHPPIFNPSIWSPSLKDGKSNQNYEVVSFSYQR